MKTAEQYEIEARNLAEMAASNARYLREAQALNAELVAALEALTKEAAMQIGVPLEDCIAGPIGEARAALSRAKG